MKVLLKEDVYNIGYAGEIHTVADGYGRNYLIPRGLAVKATPKALKEAEAWRRRAEARREALRKEYEALSGRINELRLTFKARASESGKLFGSVTAAQVTEALNEELGTEIDRRVVGAEPLRRLGEHKVTVRLSSDFQPELTVVIEPEGEVVPEDEREEVIEEVADVYEEEEAETAELVEASAESAEV